MNKKRFLKMFYFEQIDTELNTNIFYEKFLSENIKRGDIKDFAGIFEHPYIPEYYLVSCAECLGEKIVPMARRKMWKAIAHELVAMAFNDLACTGAIPMFFVDYLATNSLNIDNAGEFIGELRFEVEKYNCTLLCGKTAQLGSLIEENHFDVAGIVVGILKKEKLLSKDNVQKDDLVIGLKSNGLHTGGFNIIKNLYQKRMIDENVIEQTLQPSFIYSDVIEKCAKKSLIKSASHISNGGILKNIARSIPYGLYAQISKENIPKQTIFEELRNIMGDERAYRNFNMGVGFTIITSEENVSEVMDIAHDFEPFILGKIKTAITKDDLNKRVNLK